MIAKWNASKKWNLLAGRKPLPESHKLIKLGSAGDNTASCKMACAGDDVIGNQAHLGKDQIVQTEMQDYICWYSYHVAILTYCNRYIFAYFSELYNEK